jgi:magnesium transporter
MVGKILIPEIRSLIEARNFAGLRELFGEWPPADVAEVIVDMPEDDRVIIFRVLPAALAADVFEYLDVDAQQSLLHCMAHEQVAAILNEMSPDDRTALLEEMPSAAARQLIKLLTPEERRIAQALLGYPEGSVGRLMTPDFVAAREHWTVKEVLDYVREHGQDRETLNFIYVVDERGKLIDDLRIRNFLLRPLDTRVDQIMDRNYVHLTVTQNQEEALQIFRKYDRAALPVVDSNDVLVGIVTQDDMLDVAEEQATEAHCHRHAGLQQRDRKGRDSGDVLAVDYFERRQFWIAGDHARYPGDGSGRIASARLVPCRPQGTPLGTFARPDSRNHRCFPNLALAISAYF